MYETMMEERAAQAQEVMLHPLLLKPVQLDLEKEAMAALLDQKSIHRQLFGFRESSPKEKGVLSKRILQFERSPKKTAFSMVLVDTLKENMKDSRLSRNVEAEERSLPEMEKPESKRRSVDSIPSERSEIIFKEIPPEGVMEWERFKEDDPRVFLNGRSEQTRDPVRTIGESVPELASNGSDEESILKPGGARQRSEIREEIRLMVEREGHQDDSSDDEALISSFTPSFEEGMTQEGEREFKELVYELVRGVQILKGNGKSGLRLQLSPEQFGQMEVQLVMDEKKGIQIKFVVADQRTRSFILSGLDLLKSNLFEAGVDIKRVEVELRDDSKIEGDLDKFHLREIKLQDLAGRIDYVA